ncbi:Cof-type HAD-IIB family hydrolase [Bacillus coahuilensis]|uniref:Cof-type HAD-IIB family hydrolase n=1 Tax=Bacillus coahuilensis TaxID=408580 RepID=UPI000185142F|nr:Cof-type HAD-IIB family hydrolase [Bacillus coahuilensis]
MYKMIVLDLDDTLLRDDHTISERTKEALMKAQDLGVKVVLASGRPTYGMRSIAKELLLHQYGSYILSFNGGKIIHCESEEELFSSTLSVETVEKLYHISKEEGIHIHTYMGDEIITESMNEFTDIEGELTGMNIREVKSFVSSVNEPVVKLLMMTNPEELKVIEKKLQERLHGELSVMRSKPYFLEFTEADVTKGTSLHTLIQKLGIEQREVMAFGDSYNDLAMIEFAGLGVAMGNAPEDIKERADLVTDTNMNDGIAKVIEEYILSVKQK